MKIRDRFWAKVKRGSDHDCWEWQAAKAGGGKKAMYGYFRYNSKMIYAHRFAYLLLHGELPADQMIRHKCDNPLCCNPAHLIAGTQADNMQDAIERGRIAKGENIGGSILTKSNVRKIKARIKNGETHKSIATDFGVVALLFRKYRAAKIGLGYDLRADPKTQGHGGMRRRMECYRAAMAACSISAGEDR